MPESSAPPWPEGKVRIKSEELRTGIHFPFLISYFLFFASQLPVFRLGPVPDVRTAEVYLKTEYFLDPTLDPTGIQVNRFGNLLPMDIHHGMVAAFRENVDEHGQGQRIGKELRFGIYIGTAGQGMPKHDGHELLIDAMYDLLKEFGVFELITVQSTNQVLSSVNDDFCGDGQDAQAIVSPGIQF
jgi:hypothetical protein